jgi:hypothetical protein
MLPPGGRNSLLIYHNCSIDFFIYYKSAMVRCSNLDQCLERIIGAYMPELIILIFWQAIGEFKARHRVPKSDLGDQF